MIFLRITRILSNESQLWGIYLSFTNNQTSPPLLPYALLSLLVVNFRELAITIIFIILILLVHDDTSM